jgi:hypothetical protein
VTEKQDNLESFARRVETRVKAGAKGTDSMERLICRLMAAPKANPKIAAFLAGKWVEWRYGRSVEVKHSGTVMHEHIDLSGLSDEQLQQVEQIIESSIVGSNQG